MGALPGSARGAPKGEIDDASQQGSQAPRSRSHEQDGRSLHRRPRARSCPIEHIRRAVTPAASPSRPIAPAPRVRLRRARRHERRAIKAKTGCTWERWVGALDYHGAEQMSHREIAALVSTKFKVGSWWTQTVTVGYERIKGLRARGQRRDGSYEATSRAPSTCRSRRCSTPGPTRACAAAGWTARSAGAHRHLRRSRCASTVTTAASSPSASCRRGRQERRRRAAHQAARS